jgi:hypothetical protein
VDLTEDDEGDTNTEHGKQFYTYFGLEAAAYDEELFQVEEIDREKKRGKGDKVRGKDRERNKGRERKEEVKERERKEKG